MLPIAHVLAFDIDGALLKEEGCPDMIRDNRELWSSINRQAKHASFVSQSVMLFSSRQSMDVDNFNRKYKERSLRDDPTSCFMPLKRIAEEELKSTLCYTLLPDAYAEQADGYSYTKALLRVDDHTAYHPGSIFDQNKTGLLYLHAHTAASNMRNCDFLFVASRPKKLFQLACRSNAAYVYIEDEKALLYVNKAKKEQLILSIRDFGRFVTMRQYVNECIENEEHNFETLSENNTVMKGITLSDAQIIEMGLMIGHQHSKQDYPIIYDAIEDMTSIMDCINRTYQNNTALLPRNVIVRLNLYSINQSNLRSRVYCTIRGTGPIDLKPKETVMKLAKKIVGKEVLTEEDFQSASCFSSVMTSSNDCFKARSVSMPTVARHPQFHETWAPISNYSYPLTPDDKKCIENFIEEKSHRAPKTSPLLGVSPLLLVGVSPTPVQSLPEEFVLALRKLQCVEEERHIPKILERISVYSKYATPKLKALLDELVAQYGLAVPAASHGSGVTPATPAALTGSTAHKEAKIAPQVAAALAAHGANKEVKKDAPTMPAAAPQVAGAGVPSSSPIISCGTAL